MRPDRIFDILARHTIAIIFSFTSRASGKHLQATYTAILARHRHKHFLITAGHVINCIESTINNRELSYDSCVLADCMHPSEFMSHPIPTDPFHLDYSYEFNTDNNHDIGIIMLNDYYARLLSSNNLLPITDANCADFMDENIEGFILVGTPIELAQREISANNTAGFTPCILSFTRETPFPGHVARDQFGRMTATLNPLDTISSIEGMSGGPILGLRLAPQISYNLVAIQSSILPSRRIIYAHPAIDAFRYAKNAIDDAGHTWKRLSASRGT